MGPGAELNSEWCRARAEFNHDLLEKQVLPVLIASAGSPGTLQRAKVLRVAWTDILAPALAGLIGGFPSCSLPGQLIANFGGNTLMTQVDELASNVVLASGETLRSIRDRLELYSVQVPKLLSGFENNPEENERLSAVSAILALRKALYDAPRGIVLP